MPIRYRKISGADLAKGIEAANVTTGQFAALFGVQPKRIERWLKDEVEIPHSVALFVGLIADPLVLEKALVITQYMVDKSEPAPAAREKRQKGEKAEKGAKRARAEKREGNGEAGRARRLKARRSEAPRRPVAEAPATGSASQTR
ncbi:hypothetical protein [Hansschlegelia zhihuaiae]|uniref:Helix-turn-helix domain-containing protein n=1 Tax=Hansschlegelia zhihuaiae TaxID=405005 RepID=A0A4Q0ML04_9HYPH|nr:hypothetical protein [Hansschlegelia zhihuaiae]RXF74391.1 hypothetical protein EK403_06115 [Hansschlegelia zhihuaiae]